MFEFNSQTFNFSEEPYFSDDTKRVTISVVDLQILLSSYNQTHFRTEPPKNLLPLQTCVANPFLDRDDEDLFYHNQESEMVSNVNQTNDQRQFITNHTDHGDNRGSEPPQDSE